MHATRTLGRLWMHLEAINHRQALNRIPEMVSDLVTRADARAPRTHPPTPTPQETALPGTEVSSDPVPPQPTPAPEPIILLREGAPCILGPETRVRSRSPRRITQQPPGDEAGSTDIIPHKMGTLSTRHRVVWQGQTTRQRQNTEEIVRSLLVCVLAHVGCVHPPG